MRGRKNKYNSLQEKKNAHNAQMRAVYDKRKILISFAKWYMAQNNVTIYDLKNLMNPPDQE